LFQNELIYLAWLEGVVGEVLEEDEVVLDGVVAEEVVADIPIHQEEEGKFLIQQCFAASRFIG
jgi:hypothetical protein